MCCLRLTHVQNRQNAFTQSTYSSLNFDVRIKTLITKLKDDDNLESKTVKGHLKMLKCLIFLNNIMNVLLEIMEKSTPSCS